MYFAGNYNHSRRATLYESVCNESVCNEFSFETFSDIKLDDNRLGTKLEESRHNIAYPSGEVQAAGNALDSASSFTLGCIS